ncbi:PAS domain-containing protein, partial [Arthrospira platensis SPKY1]|nr:PAS domain-containing protein [Arthrospira platensis SPKY1]
MFEHARENILVVSADGLIVEPNPSMCRATGFTRDQLKGKSIDQVQHNGAPGSLWQVQWAALKTDGSWSGEC